MALPQGFTKTEQWAVISQKFCRYLGLPNGSSFKVKVGNRIQRNDTIYRRKPFKKKIRNLPDDLNIATAIREHLLPYLDIDLNDRRVQIIAYGPNKKPIDHKTFLGTFRNKPGIPTEAELQEEEYRKAEINEAADEAYGYLRNLEELRTADTVIQAVIRALAERYDRKEVRRIAELEL